jgi:hypothetical protein
MDRRAFLTGLFGVGGAVALAGVAEAAPIARTLGLAHDAQPTEGLRTPDGTKVENAQLSVQVGPRRSYRSGSYYRRRRRYYRGYRRRYYRGYRRRYYRGRRRRVYYY